jgi:hypothetical protein
MAANLVRTDHIRLNTTEGKMIALITRLLNAFGWASLGVSSLCGSVAIIGKLCSWVPAADRPGMTPEAVPEISQPQEREEGPPVA